ncbi:hypothetical protein HPP92_000795 [Vanilla planifolia]|uniref:O-methyltransferase dimerisation domain-containing protein n=1 Tax=Vanilla planifolia TaxID=51239 RepID=A0A835VCZ0_VANPL|nr:hypothetical protein HPP92_000795 [Vanilla planifolia]
MIPVAENMKQQHGGALHEELDHDAYTYAMQLVSFSVLPMTLRVAVEVGLLNLISASGSHLSADEITARLETSNSLASPIIERILRLLCSYSILTFSSSTDAQGRSIVRYGAAPVCRYLALTRMETPSLPLSS